MVRSLLEDNKAEKLNIQFGLKANATRQAISGAFTVAANMGPIIWLDPTGAQNVTFPTKGSRFIFLVQHGSSNNVDLTLKDSAAVTIGTLSQNEMAIVWDDGVVTCAGILKQT